MKEKLMRQDLHQKQHVLIPFGRDTQPWFFRYDLAELLLRLRQYDKAEKVLQTALGEEQSKWKRPTVKIQKICTPENLAVIILNFEQSGFTIQ